MLSNAYFLAKFRFDTAENEPAKNLQNFRKMHFSKMHFSKNAFFENAFFENAFVVQPCSHPMPSPILEKVRKKGIFVVFLRKEKSKASKRLQRTLLGPQPRLQASAVLSKTAKCLARERTRSRAQRDNDLICAGHAAAPSWKKL